MASNYMSVEILLFVNGLCKTTVSRFSVSCHFLGLPLGSAGMGMCFDEASNLLRIWYLLAHYCI